VSSAAIAGVLNAAISGAPVTQVRDDIYLVNAIVRATDSERASFETLASLQCPRPAGAWCRSSSSRPSSRSRSSRWCGARPGADPDGARRRHPGVLPDDVVTTLAPKIAAFGAELPKP